jgi:hypothetical protein
MSLLLVRVSRGPLCTYPSTLCVYHVPIKTKDATSKPIFKTKFLNLSARLQTLTWPEYKARTDVRLLDLKIQDFVLISRYSEYKDGHLGPWKDLKCD